jgi:hypothetical protein
MGTLLTFIALAAIATGATLIVHHRQWGHGSAPNFVLVVIPAALLFMILPVAPLMLQTVRSFQQIGTAGTDAASTIGELSLQIARTLWIGTLAVLLTMVVAALLQVGAGAATPPPARDGDPARSLGGWILVACTVLLLPTALLMFIVEQVPRLAVHALEITAANPTSPDLSGFSEQIVLRLIVGTWFGAGLSFVEVAAGVVAVVAAGSIRQQRTPWVPWVAFGVMMVIASWNVRRLQGDLRWIERATAAAAQASSRVPHAKSTTGVDAGPFRFDGVYRTDARPDGTFDYWVFQPGSRCWPYSSPSDHASPPAPAAGRHWTCTADGEAVVVLHSDNDAVVKIERGTIRGRDSVVIEGTTYRFIDEPRTK